ncbi:hypothetical protein FJTKL_10386 [Diaporthe vaccinii]|uniref:Uncharacterized protein n=1 Tax=Diaporthe vaccinii TaxID=105482 RepID=A0ABR4EK00_9PEZI
MGKMNSGDCWFAQFKLGWEEQALLGDSHRMLHQALISGRRTNYRHSFNLSGPRKAPVPKKTSRCSPSQNFFHSTILKRLE